MGVLTRRGHGRRTELAFTPTSVVLGTIPDFLSASGWSTCSASASAGSRWPATTRPSAYVLPVLALAIGPAAILARIVRVEMLAVLRGRLHPDGAGQAAARRA